MRAVEPMVSNREHEEEPLRATLLVDSAGRIAGTYGRASEVFGYSEHELLMLRVHELVDSTDALAPLGRRKNGTLFPIKVERDPLTFDAETLVVLTIDPTVQRPEIVDLNEFVASSGVLLEPLLDEGIKLRVVPAPGWLPIRVDRGQLEHALTNLVTNACEAMPAGGTLEIASSTIELDETAAAERRLPAGSYAVLVVRDTGRGLPEQIQTRIFDPFFTTKHLGTGLGLSAAHEIVERANGRIAVHSGTDGGAEFSIMVPPAAMQLRSQDAPQTVLVVDDEESLRTLARVILEDAGYEVLEAASGREALETIANDPPIHILLTDIVMPGLSGPELAARVRADVPEIAVVYMSGHTRGVPIDVAIPLVPKPFRAGQLTAAVELALDQRNAVYAAAQAVG
jgi:CheY-like chemotaxis protein